jgi:transcriptional regulator with XRE-family HTH domain
VDDSHADPTDELQINAVIQGRIKQEITESGLQDADIAGRTGLSASQIGRMRRGEADNLTVKSLLRLSRAFSRPPEYWLSTDSPDVERTHEPSLVTPDADHDLLARHGIQAVLTRGIADLDPLAQREIVRFVDSVRRLRGMDEVAGDLDVPGGAS